MEHRNFSLSLITLALCCPCFTSFGMFVIPGQPEDAPLKIQKTGAQLEIAKHRHTGPVFDNPWVQEVIKKFDAIPQKASASVTASENGIVPSIFHVDNKDVVSDLLQDKLGMKKRLAGLSHFQSIKRVPGTNYVYIAANDAKRSVGQLLIIQMGSQPKTGTWHSTPSKLQDHPQDKVIKLINLSEGATRRHPGGMDICGKYLVVPMEGNDPTDEHFVAAVYLYDISDAENPKKLAPELDTGTSCMACALARLPDEHYLLATFTNSNRFDLFYSKTTKFEDGFYNTPTAFDVPLKPSRGNYQNINFITQADGTLCMVAAQNTDNMAPVINGDNYMDLFIIEYDIVKLAKINEQLAVGKQQPIPTSEVAYGRCVRQKNFSCEGYCNFNASATLFIQDPNHIAVYACPHWPKDGKVRFNVYEQ